ncbi:KpsF/GutQ family sugar-phosphate isomerase [Woodsholea maritima]|uniref:KpsF/GutQ family sugar-phosphate isomerase n=1 Tax=Woodsholea maritima TaxID=240237 RepID=UPI000374781E|nr:KpsF/GutQ family sugar-phosphate isomerase [Woodsholea maritima]
MDQDRLLSAMRRTLAIEAEGLKVLEDSLNGDAVKVVELIAGLKGRLICAGVGKSGHVARKIAATLASTGTPAQYVHPSEASHGDMGMITQHDGVLALSKSGETKELGDMIAYCRRFGVPLIAMTTGAQSSLAKGADHLLLLPNVPEACGETRAPTTSTTLQIALGDALAVALIEAKGFTAQDFGVFHPGGALGAALLSVENLMHRGDVLPLVSEDALMSEVLLVMSQKGFGCVGVLHADKTLGGIITDGDLRRHMGSDLLGLPAKAVMTANPTTVHPDILAASALRLMTAGTRKILQIFVVDDANRPQGLIHIHDLLRAGIS